MLRLGVKKFKTITGVLFTPPNLLTPNVGGTLKIL